MRSTYPLLLIIVPFLCCAQVETVNGQLFMSNIDTPATDRAGDVVLKVTPEVEKLLNAYSEHKHPQKGYRVQIFLGDRATAEATKRSFLQKNPDVPAYLSWLAPNFRLRVGDLRTRLEAEHLLRDMKVLYPGSYIVPDEIEMPRMD